MTENEQKVYDFFKAKGLSNNAIYGIMGNVKVESNFNSTAENTSSGAYGLFQWLGSRKTALANFAKENNLKKDDINTQLEFAWYELNTTEKKTLTELTSNTNTVSDFAKKFDQLFERSEGTTVKERQDYAKEYYKNSSFLNKIDGGNQAMSETYLQYTGEVTGAEKKTDILSNVFKAVLIILVVIGGIAFMGLSIGSFTNIKGVLPNDIKS